MKKVGLSESSGAVNEQRVVVLAGLLGHGHGSRPCKSVGLTHHKTLEPIPRDEVGGFGGGGRVLGGDDSRRIFAKRKRLLDRRDIADAIKRAPLARVGRLIGGVDEFTVFVTYPAKVKLRWCDQDQGVFFMVCLEPGEPGFPIPFGYPGAQGISEFRPAVTCSWCLGLKAAPPVAELSTDPSTPVETSVYILQRVQFLSRSDGSLTDYR